MTWLLAADAGELTEDEAQELAAEQRLLAHGQRMLRHAGQQRLLAARQARDEQQQRLTAWWHAQYDAPRQSWLHRLYTYLTTGWWPSC